MESCGNHPAERAAGRVCIKYPVHFFEQCACFRDPKRYRKHRAACIICFVAKKGVKITKNTKIKK